LKDTGTNLCHKSQAAELPSYHVLRTSHTQDYVLTSLSYSAHTVSVLVGWWCLVSSKLTLYGHCIRLGAVALLRTDKGSINILENLINRIITPTDPEGGFVYHSE